MIKKYKYFIVKPEVSICSYYDLIDTRDTNCYEVTKDLYLSHLSAILKDQDLHVHHVRDCRASFIIAHQFGDDKIIYQGFMKLDK